MEYRPIHSRLILHLVNICYMLTGVFLLLIACYVIKSHLEYEEVLENYYLLLPAGIILVIAAAMLLIGFMGSWAVFTESLLSLTWFTVIISIIVSAGIAGIMSGFEYRDEISPHLEENMNQLFKEYDGGTSVRSSAVVYIQEKLVCCGVNNYTFWSNHTWTNKTEATSVPLSCCRANATSQTCSLDHPEEIHTSGCEEKLEIFIHEIIGIALAIIMVFTGLGMFGLYCMCVLQYKKYSKYRHGYRPL